jgi:hypothetical protein
MSEGSKTILGSVKNSSNASMDHSRKIHDMVSALMGSESNFSIVDDDSSPSLSALYSFPDKSRLSQRSLLQSLPSYTASTYLSDCLYLWMNVPTLIVEGVKNEMLASILTQHDSIYLTTLVSACSINLSLLTFIIVYICCIVNMLRSVQRERAEVLSFFLVNSLVFVLGHGNAVVILHNGC